MADPIYGIHQSQPRDVFNYLKSNAKKLGIVGAFDYLPNIVSRAGAVNNQIGLPEGMELIVSDEVSYYDEPMMNGQVRRYAKIRFFLATFGTFTRSERDDVAEQVKVLGYSEVQTTRQIESALEFTNTLGIASNRINALLFTGASVVEVKAGVARYSREDLSILDAPHDGREYVRVDGDWVLSDHFVHSSVDGGEATV